MNDGRNNNVKGENLVVEQPGYRRAWYYRPGVGIRSEYHRWWFVEVKETSISGESTGSQETQKQKQEEMKVKFAWSAIVMLLAAFIAVAYCIFLLWKLINLIRNEEENQNETLTCSSNSDSDPNSDYDESMEQLHDELTRKEMARLKALEVIALLQVRSPLLIF